MFFCPLPIDVSAHKNMIPQSSTEADPVSLHLEGMRLFHAGQREQGLSLVRRAVDLTPENPLLHFNLATLHHASRDLRAAEAECREGLRWDPAQPVGLNNLGGILLEMGQMEEAESFLREAIRRQQAYPDPMFNLGLLLCRQKRWEEAAAVLEKAVRLQPDHSQGVMNLGAALSNLARYEEALPHNARAAAVFPQDAKAQYNLGTTLHKLRRHEEAVGYFRKAVELDPGFGEAWGNLGIGLLKLRRRKESETTLLRAAEINPSIPFVWNGLGLIAMAKAEFAAARAHFEKALELAPGLPEALFNRGCMLLLQGNFAEGWKDYLGVRGCKENSSASRFAGGFWDGAPQPKGPVILQAEQGFGDTIQFIRYATLVKERAREVILECPPQLLKLMKTATGVDRVIPVGNSLPKGAPRIPLLNLPALFGTDLANIPAQTPYLFPQGELPPALAQSLAQTKGKKVGLCWQGNPNHPEDDRRSIPGNLFEELKTTPGVIFFSLQKGAGREDVQLKDFNDSALLIRELDLVISVDTSVAHLAGALGKPVWLLLPFVPEWRWLRERSDSPWYPSMRIFRQSKLGDWSGPLAEIRKALQT